MKKLYAAILAIALITALVVPVGVANACPQPPKFFRPMHVSGTLEMVSWPMEESTYSLDPTTGEYVWSNNIITWNMHGDLEGTLIENLTIRGNTSNTYYTQTADQAFEGTLMGQPVSFQTKAVGWGNNTGEAGSSCWVSYVCGSQSDVRGAIFCKGSFTGPDISYSYCGTLTWQRVTH